MPFVSRDTQATDQRRSRYEELRDRVKTKDQSRSFLALTASPRLEPTESTPIIGAAPQTFEFIPARTRSQSPAKRKTDYAGGVSRAKRSKSDAVDRSLNTSTHEPIPFYISEHEDSDVTEKLNKSSPASSVYADAYEGQADRKEELHFLEITSKTLDNLHEACEQAAKHGDELLRCTHEVAHVMDKFLASRTSKVGALEKVDTSQTPVLTPWSKEVAKELVRRLKRSYGYAEVINPNLEIEHCANIFYLMKLREGAPTVPHDATPAMFFILPTLREEREDAYYALVSHPYITHKTSSSLKDMERQLKHRVMHFFDKCFTYQVATVYGIEVGLHGPLLRIGGDEVFKSTDGLDTGGEDWQKLDNYNQGVWQELVHRSVGLPTHNNGNYIWSKRSRAETSMGSLGLTDLFLGDEKDAEYEGDDEAIPQEQNLSPEHKEHRKNSNVDWNEVAYGNSKVEFTAEPQTSALADGEDKLDSHSWSSPLNQGVNSDSAKGLLMRSWQIYNEGDYMRLSSERMDDTDVVK